MPLLTLPVAATATYTGTGVFTDTQTVVIGGVTYTSQTSLTNVDGHFFKGSSQAEGHTNLMLAVNGQGDGTKAAAACTANPYVKATSADNTHTYFAAKIAGTIGNQIPTTETQTNGSFGGTVMSGGTGDVVTILSDIVTYGQLNSDAAQAMANLLNL